MTDYFEERFENLTCHDCERPVGLYDAGDSGPDGTAAIGWEDFTVQEYTFKYGSTIRVYHLGCVPQSNNNEGTL
jgi:hypothetical protein